MTALPFLATVHTTGPGPPQCVYVSEAFYNVKYPCHRGGALLFVMRLPIIYKYIYIYHKYITRSSWFKCILRDDDAMYWVSNTDSIGHYEAVAVDDW